MINFVSTFEISCAFFFLRFRDKLERTVFKLFSPLWKNVKMGTLKEGTFPVSSEIHMAFMHIRREGIVFPVGSIPRA